MNGSKQKRTPLASSKSWLILSLTATLPILINVASCQVNPSAPEFKLRAKFYATDSRTQSIIRKNEVIKCDSPKFDDRICITNQEVANIMKDAADFANKCEKWKDDARPVIEVHQ